MKKLSLAAVIALVGLGCNDRRTSDSLPPPAVDSGPGTDSSTGMDSGGSGVDPTRTIDTLTLEEARAVCVSFIAAQGGPGTVVMCDGFDITIQTVDDCAATVDAATCTRTVGEIDACSEAIAGDACLLATEPACSFFSECATAG